MPNPFVVSGPMLQEVAHGLLDMKAKARSIESSTDAYLPLVDDEETRKHLERIVECSQTIASSVSHLYSKIAREAAQV